jgi:hypothetical protein
MFDYDEDKLPPEVKKQRARLYERLDEIDEERKRIYDKPSDEKDADDYIRLGELYEEEQDIRYRLDPNTP